MCRLQFVSWCLLLLLILLSQFHQWIAISFSCVTARNEQKCIPEVHFDIDVTYIQIVTLVFKKSIAEHPRLLRDPHHDIQSVLIVTDLSECGICRVIKLFSVQRLKGKIIICESHQSAPVPHLPFCISQPMKANHFLQFHTRSRLSFSVFLILSDKTV